ncbi:MAG: 3-deoxy-8-phosphooctulonate synthase [Gemmatimonadales bacterium]|nr:MAG: 3-deoxy-8-phosphooctulonate synthase [Gemmatimonadales bacterium]
MIKRGPLFFADTFLLIAGPCVLEGADLNLKVARHIQNVAESTGVTAVFKASFDKANRTNLASPRGPGLRDGVVELSRIRDETGLPVLTDVHETHQVEMLAGSVDALQIPAFLCRQTDLLTAAGGSGLPVNIKKGQWMAPEEMRHPAEKVRAGGGRDIAVTERGTSFGYGRWVVDMRGFRIMQAACACPVLFDATHSVQLPASGSDGLASGGEPVHIETLARAAVAAGANGLFVEVHPDPASAPSDGANMLQLDDLESLVAGLLRVRDAVGPELVL